MDARVMEKPLAKFKQDNNATPRVTLCSEELVDLCNGVVVHRLLINNVRI